MDEKFYADKAEVWTSHEKKAAEFQKDLLDHNAFEAGKVLRYPGQCGSHLSKLWKKDGAILTGNFSDDMKIRVSKRVLDGHALWTIYPPSKTEN